MFAGICWKTFCAKNPNHTNNLKDMNFNMLRIFVDLAYLRNGVSITDNSTKWQAYIDNTVNTMPDGMTKWTFEDFEKPFWSANPNDTFKDNIDLCKQLNWLPIFCLGFREEEIEPYTFLHRCPTGSDIAWLKRFSQEFAYYLKNVYQFARCDLEIYNEPNEAMSATLYVALATNMCLGWKTAVPYYKTHVFACDIQHQSYLDEILDSDVLLHYVDYISPHILTYPEWDINLINGTYEKIKAVGKKMSLLEISPLDDMTRLMDIVSKADMYALLLGIRNSNIGTAFDITDLLIYDFDNPNEWISVEVNKMRYVKDFNAKYFNETISEDDMQLDKIYKYGSKGIGVRFIQKVLNADVKPVPLLITDGVWGIKTTDIVKQYQAAHGLKIDGIVGAMTFKDMINKYPAIWDEIEYEYCIGVR